MIVLVLTTAALLLVILSGNRVCESCFIELPLSGNCDEYDA